MFIFTIRELKELFITAVVITFVVAWPDVFGIRGLINFALLFLFIGLGFVVHEIAHKLTAQSLGAWSEFIMWKSGLIFAFFLKIIGGPTIIAPGATYWVKPLATVDDEGKVAMAGPLANIALAFIFSILAVFVPIMRIGAYINAQLALFNLIPIPPLDGYKIMLWRPIIWILLALLAFILG